MMEYNTFKEAVVESIKGFLPPVYREFELEVTRVPKINGMKEAMVLSFDSDHCRLVAPNIYLDEMFDDYCADNDMERILRKISEIIVVYTCTQNLNDREYDEFDMYNDNIVKVLINTDLNKDLLEGAPHMAFLDLSVVYRIVMRDLSGEGYASALVTNDLLEDMGITLEELDNLAEINSRRIMKTKVMALGPEFRMMLTDVMCYGAVNLLREDELHKIAEELDGNLYIMPSSIHDLMVLKDTGHVKEEDLFSIVKKGNDTCNSAEENLSYNIYYYDREKAAVGLKERGNRVRND